MIMDNGSKREILRYGRLTAPHAECKCEFSLPDYLGDVRKVLLTDAHARGAGRFADGEGAEFPGIVVFDVVYLDSDGEICSVSFNGDYDMRVKNPSENGVELFVDPEIDSYSIRLPGPRKISAKAVLSGRTYVTESVQYTADGTAFAEGASPEMRTEEITVEGMRRSPVMEREYGETLIHLDGAMVDEVKVMYPRAQIRLDSVTATDEGALVKGEIRMTAIVKNGDEPAFCVTRSVPLEQTVPCDLTDGSELVGGATVTSVSYAVNADDTGSEVVLSVISELFVDEFYNQKTDVVVDAYMTECVTENIYEDVESVRFNGVIRERFGCQGEISRMELDASNLREVVCMCSSVKVDGSECVADQLKIDGTVQFFGICSTTLDNGEVSYIGVKTEASFTKNVNINCQNPLKMTYDLYASTNCTSGVIDADKVYATCDVTVEVRVAEIGNLRALCTCNARADLPFAKDGSVVTVYYPAKGESLFSIAKRFHTTVSALAEMNSLAETVMTGGSDVLAENKILIY